MQTLYDNTATEYHAPFNIVSLHVESFNWAICVVSLDDFVHLGCWLRLM